MLKSYKPPALDAGIAEELTDFVQTRKQQATDEWY